MTIVPCWIVFHRGADGKYRAEIVEDSEQDANYYVRANAKNAQEIAANWGIQPCRRNNKGSNLSAPVRAGEVHIGVPDTGL